MNSYFTSQIYPTDEVQDKQTLMELCRAKFAHLMFEGSTGNVGTEKYNK